MSIGVGIHKYYGTYNYLPTYANNKNIVFQTGHPWFSILTRTGVFKGKENHDKFPADLVIPCHPLKNNSDTYPFFLSISFKKEIMFLFHC